MGQVPRAEWLADVADEDPDAAPFIPQARAADEDGHLTEDLILPWEAWRDLRHDRAYGAFGGQSPISFMALHHWAESNGLGPEHFAVLKALVRAIDDEYLTWMAEQERLRAARAKSNQ